MTRALSLLVAVAALSASSAMLAGRPAPGSAAPSLAEEDGRRVPSRQGRHPLAAIIPGSSEAEVVLAVGTQQFFAYYNTIITVRVLLSWIPQARAVGFLQPIFFITEPALSLFRGIIPPIGGLDLSPLPVFFLINAAANNAAPVISATIDRMRPDAMDVAATFPKVNGFPWRGVEEGDKVEEAGPGAGPGALSRWLQRH